MPQTFQETELRPIARQRIAEGSLPCTLPSQVWTGPGSGKTCALCGAPIPVHDFQHEVHHLGQDRLLKVFLFHIICHSIWQIECAQCGYIRRGDA